MDEGYENHAARFMSWHRARECGAWVGGHLTLPENAIHIPPFRFSVVTA